MLLLDGHIFEEVEVREAIGQLRAGVDNGLNDYCNRIRAVCSLAEIALDRLEKNDPTEIVQSRSQEQGARS